MDVQDIRFLAMQNQEILDNEERIVLLQKLITTKQGMGNQKAVTYLNNEITKLKAYNIGYDNAMHLIG